MTSQKDKGEGFFELETPRLLEVNMLPRGAVWTKMGSMISYQGAIKFTREGILEHGVGKMLKKAFTGESLQLTKAEGSGKLYLADAGKKVSILQLAGESIWVNGNDVLAFEPDLDWDIKMLRKVAAVLSGGLFSVRVQGTGMLAITTHYEPVTLKVSASRPVVTDPNATVAWSGNLQPEFRTDVSLRTFVGRGSGESLQMQFSGSEGFVVVQPFEEVVFRPSR